MNSRFMLTYLALLSREGYENSGSPWIRPPSLFSENFNGLLFGWTYIS